MPVIPCIESSPCLDPANPVTNFSSEAPDPNTFFSLQWPYTNPDNPVGGLPCDGCGVECSSTVSQEAADLCAAAQVATCCLQQQGQDPVCNDAQMVIGHCADGTQFEFTVPACLFVADSKASANALAQAYAAQQAPGHSVCPSNIPQCLCVASAYNSTITATVGPLSTGQLSFSVSGTLPPGIRSSVSGNSLVISGAPSMPGQFPFSVTVADGAGTTCTKNYVLTVLQILTVFPVQYQIGVPYSFQMRATGGSGNYAWKISSGTLPPGLTLSSSGLISGTPTTNSASTFTIGVIDVACEAADKSFNPPAVALSGVSTTQIGQMFGFPEYAGFVSNPPKLYRKATWQGSSEQDFFVGSQQVAGARYDWSGSSEIDFFGNYISLYTKDLSAMCQAYDDPNSNLCAAAEQFQGQVTFIAKVPGWFQGPGQTTQCQTPGLPFTQFGNKAVGKGQQALYDSSPFASGLAFDQNGQFIGNIKTFQPSSGASASDTASGSQIIFTALSPVTCGLAFAPGVPAVPYPNAGFNGFNGSFQWNNNYSATLSEEYTEALALQNGQTLTGIGLTASNTRNPTGSTFVIIETSIAWTMSFTNLLSGEAYTATYQTIDQSGNVTTNTLNFTATGKTFVISGNLPVPARGNTLTIRNATVSFS